MSAALAAALATVGAGGMVLAGARPDGRMHVTVLAVGAAPAVLVRTGDGGLALVDAGGQPDRLLRALGDALPGTTHTIDLVVLTGGERAAVAGLSGLAGRYMVTRALIPRVGIGSGAVAALQALRDGGTEVIVGDSRPWRWAGADWRCLSAGPADTASGAGPACALQILGEGGSVLVVGDLPTSAQEEVAAFTGSSLHADLVVTPPGGSLAPALIDAARPRAIAIPSDRTPRLSSTEAGGASVRSTAADGALDYVGGPEGLHVT
jgi:beta-lactamase superfamily II metal-dependent hydrolase